MNVPIDLWPLDAFFDHGAQDAAAWGVVIGLLLPPLLAAGCEPSDELRPVAVRPGDDHVGRLHGARCAVDLGLSGTGLLVLDRLPAWSSDQLVGNALRCGADSTDVAAQHCPTLVRAP